MTPAVNKPTRLDADREDVVSTSDGTITYNYLQQPEPDVLDDDTRARITTDPWGITS